MPRTRQPHWCNVTAGPGCALNAHRHGRRRHSFTQWDAVTAWCHHAWILLSMEGWVAPRPPWPGIAAGSRPVPRPAPPTYTPQAHQSRFNETWYNMQSRQNLHYNIFTTFSRQARTLRQKPSTPTQMGHCLAHSKAGSP